MYKQTQLFYLSQKLNQLQICLSYMESKLLSVQTTVASLTEIERNSHMRFSNNILPIFDHLSQIYLPFQSLEIIQIFFCLIQIFQASFWCENVINLKNSKIFDTFHYIAFFSSSLEKSTENKILTGIFVSIVFIITILFFISIFHYAKGRRINKPILYIIRIYFLFFGAAILHPFASLTGHLFHSVIENHKGEDIAMLIFSFIGFLVAEALFCFYQYFVNQSIYIHKSLWMTFDSTLLLFMFMWNPLFLLLGNLFYYYPKWSFYILIGFHLLLLILSCANFVWFSYIVDFGNSLSFSVICSVAFNDIFCIFAENFDCISFDVFVTICYIFFVVFEIVFFFVFKFIRNNINKKLSHSNMDGYADASDSGRFDPSIDEKYQYFIDLKLNQNVRKSMVYLLVGFTSGSEMFVDFSLVQFCIDNFKDSPKMIVLLIQLLSYFKSEKNKFDVVLQRYHQIRDSSFFGHFLYIQAHRIKIFRQTTSNNMSSTRLTELKVLSNDLENQIKSFWLLETANTHTLEYLETQKRNLNNFWDESIEDNWSSISFRDVHIRFLIESCTDYLRAVQMTSIRDRIELLMKDRDDLCFLSLLICFPKYINNRIVDKEGNYILKKKDGTTTSSVSTQSDRISTSSNEYDFTYEEHIANSILTNGKLRLAMQNALSNIKPNMSILLTLFTVLILLISTILIIVTFAYYLNSFNSFDDWNQEVGVLIDLRISYGKAFLSLSILFGQQTNRFYYDPIKCKNNGNENHFFLDQSMNFSELALYYVNEARDQFSELLDAILQLSLRRVDISTLTSLLFDESINSTICYFGEIIDYKNWSMEQALNFDILAFAILSQDDIVPHWYYNSTYWCHCIATLPNVEDQFSVIQDALANDLILSSAQIDHKIMLEMCIIGPLCAFLFLLPVHFIIFFYTREINHLIKLMLSTDSEFKEQARKNVSVSTTTEMNEISPGIAKKNLNWKFIIVFILMIISFFAFILFEELILYYSKLMNNKLGYFGYWSCDFSLLRAYLIEMLNEVLNAIYYIDYPQKYITNDTFKQRVYHILKAYERNVYKIMNDLPNNPSAMGKDDYIDKIIAEQICDIPDKFTDFHDVYKCSSLSLLLGTVHSFIEKTTEEILFHNGVFQGEELSNIYHLIFAHAISSITSLEDRIANLQTEENGNFQQNIFICFICGIIFIIIWLLLMIYIIVDFKRIFGMAICLIRRLSPVGLINNNELTNYLLYKKGEEIETGLTHTIFNNSFDGIICMNLDGIVEIVNKSFANDYGYSTEQLVGQLVGTIFDNDSRVKLENQLKLIKNHESKNYTQEVTCFTNDGRAVPSFITLFGIKGNENSLILVVRDETVLLQKKKRLELAKKQSQDLLEQIMPAKVLMMLKQGKSEISFAVPSASVVFVDIVNFSRFSSDLSPQQIMGTLSTLFGAFDVWIQKFPLMTKIKLIGDTYMAACGLFATDDEPKNHAKQSIDFCLRVLSILDDTNIKLNVSLQIRIGVNSDGPIIAGVLGTENRVFDIIGDTINVASRLEHKCEPGHILMSEKTYDLVKEFGYNIISKGAMFLKGKGDMMAYSI